MSGTEMWMSNEIILPESGEDFSMFAPPIIIDVEGSVELQRRGSDGEWQTYAVVTDPVVEHIIRARPALRIVPIGTSKFLVSGSW